MPWNTGPASRGIAARHAVESALVCDNQFFLKPTDAGKALLDRVKEAPPYPGAKPYYLVDAQLDDAEAAAGLVRATAAALPAPAAKPARKAAKKAPRGRIAGRATRPAK